MLLGINMFENWGIHQTLHSLLLVTLINRVTPADPFGVFLERLPAKCFNRRGELLRTSTRTDIGRASPRTFRVDARARAHTDVRSINVVRLLAPGGPSGRRARRSF